MKFSTAIFPFVFIILIGCADKPAPVAEKPVEPQEEKPKEKANGAKLKTTSDIAEFNPDADNEIVDSKVKITNPITGALEAYEPIKQKIAQDIQITHAVRIFEAMEGRYPKDYDEFMAKVIKANNIRLPRLAPDKQYQYDVKNHKLVVVRVPQAEK